MPEHVEVTVASRDGSRTGPQRVVAVEVEAARPHESVLPGRESGAEEPLEGRLGGGAHEEGVSGHEVERRDVEADGLHHVPRQLPECETHEPGRLEDQVRQTAPQLAADLRRRRDVDVGLLGLHGLQLFPCRVVLVDGQHVPDGYGLLDCLNDLQL